MSASGVPSGKSPGGMLETTGNASAFKERLIIGIVDVICIEPLNVLGRFFREFIFVAPCALGARLKVDVP